MYIRTSSLALVISSRIADVIVCTFLPLRIVLPEIHPGLPISIKARTWQNIKAQATGGIMLAENKQNRRSKVDIDIQKTWRNGISEKLGMNRMKLMMVKRKTPHAMRAHRPGR